MYNVSLPKLLNIDCAGNILIINRESYNLSGFEDDLESSWPLPDSSSKRYIIADLGYLKDDMIISATRLEPEKIIMREILLPAEINVTWQDPYLIIETLI
jgi:hypothetical protein